MPECEICGKSTKLVRARIENSVLHVCTNCARFGDILPEEQTRKIIEQAPIEAIEIDPSYASIIRLKREALGLKREQLARRLNEKASVLERIEHGKMGLDEKLAKKLEKALHVKLLGYREPHIDVKSQKSQDITFGDVVKLKNRKRK